MTSQHRHRAGTSVRHVHKTHEHTPWSQDTARSTRNSSVDCSVMTSQHRQRRNTRVDHVYGKQNQNSSLDCSVMTSKYRHRRSTRVGHVHGKQNEVAVEWDELF